MSIISTEDMSIQVKPNELGGAELAMASGSNLMFTQMSYDQFNRFVWECAGVLDQISPKEEATIPPTDERAFRYCTTCKRIFVDGLCPHCEADLADLPLGGDLCS